MKNTFLLFLLLFISFNSVSQNKVIDSLQQELNKDISEKEKANTLLALSKKFWYSNSKKSRGYANRVIKIARANNFKKEEATAYNYLAVTYRYTQNYNKATEYLNKAIKINKESNNEELLAKNYMSFGIIYYYTYDYYNSFLFYDKALKILREKNDIPRIAACLTNISLIYDATGNYEKSLEYTLECNSILKENTIELANSLKATADCYIKLKQTALAKTYIDKAITIFESKMDDYSLMHSSIILADIYFEEKKYLKAYAIYSSNYDKILASNDDYLKTLSSYGLSETLYALKRYKGALLYAHKSFEIANKNRDYQEIFNSSKIIAESSEKLKKYDDLASFYKIHITYKDSLVGNDFYRGKFEHELKEATYKSKKEKEIEDSKRNNLLLVVVTIFLFLFGIFGVYFYRKLKVLYKKSQESNKSKSIFLSKVTHEIKTPLTSIIGFSNLLRDSNLNKEQVLEYNNNIAISSTRLLKLSNEILETSQLKEEKVKLFEKEQNLNVFLDSIKKEYTIEANQKGLTFNVDYKLFNNQLFYDNAKLLKVIDNLLVNAIRFTDSGAVSFIINLESESEKEADINFIIKDTGIGISKKHINKIQKEFYQIISNEKDNVGIGLGLSIVKQSLSLMGSKLNIDSKLHQGSLFSFKLKLKKGELIKEEAAIGKIDKVSFSKPLKILIVEDNKLTSLLIKKMLESLFNNIKIYKAYDGVEAVNNYTEQEPDIVFMDLQMPNLNGFEATKSIRALQKSHIPIIACSASLLSDNIGKCKTFGLDDYIEKPINKELLKAILLKYITPVN